MILEKNDIIQLISLCRSRHEALDFVIQYQKQCGMNYEATREDQQNVDAIRHKLVRMLIVDFK